MDRPGPRIEPQEVKMMGPFTKTVYSSITLHNPTDQPMAFKIKTTESEHFVVQPSKAIILPHDKYTVNIALRPFISEAAADLVVGRRQKFMIVSLLLPGGEDHKKTAAEAFAGSRKEDQVENKISCVFDMPGGISKQVSTASFKSVKENLPPGLVAAAQQQEQQSATRQKVLVIATAVLILIAAHYIYQKLFVKDSEG